MNIIIKFFNIYTKNEYLLAKFIQSKKKDQYKFLSGAKFKSGFLKYNNEELDMLQIIY